MKYLDFTRYLPQCASPYLRLNDPIFKRPKTPKRLRYRKSPEHPQSLYVVVVVVCVYLHFSSTAEDNDATTTTTIAAA